MTPDQISLLLNLLERIAARPFTITQATDWQMLYVLLGFVCGILVLAVGLFWRDVSAKFKEMKKDMKDALLEFKQDDLQAHKALKIDYTNDINNLKADHVKDIDTLRTDYKNMIDNLWSAMKDCQSDCCPPRRRKDDA